MDKAVKRHAEEVKSIQNLVEQGFVNLKEAFDVIREVNKEKRNVETKKTRAEKAEKLIAVEGGEWGLTGDEWVN